ncbi:efflux RND transporter periplasmic adaptor subunit [Xanthomonas hortorum]|uniref:efflux RND transporter periplasmic adaptor subunit n=1 Tax=Xanthomonas hortorum TaxID=56454 RepID=UPI0015D58B6E|nr:efflux RND transporter periplasmic adaptor subunit [Xanthomonas hortorum]MCE4357918.1 efflux RND transporter periplasmic adaptor subunit [Xanthomonas hortorum pv. taraxaci]NMI52696.1 efflux RND transporter periplasmic adaptor subunit [Xanthomonas hortorum pv. taraxaci]CAD0303787.1 Multidrug resistance protein MdtA [Xanthomonas hortorum pv. taraxaci]CAD0303793.1 Multidrug resistance protein MdtA [Xanthomonas hortorum pv. taraxaci]
MLRRRLVTSTFLCALPLALIACGEAPPPDPRTATPLVRVATVEEAGTAARSFSGTVAARVQSDLGFRVSGKVLERLVDTGQRVTRGQPLLRIDPVDLQLAARAQQDAVAAAQARAQQTADDEARYRDLRGTGAISASAYDQIKAAADAAKAQLSAAQAQAEVARNSKRYSDLLADADGVVMETLVEPGQVVAAGQPVVRLAHAGRREAIVQLPETLRPPVGSVAQATLFGNAGVTVPATLRQLSDSADRLTRTFEAHYVLDGALADAPLGTTVSIRVADGPAASTQAGLQVPLAALFDAGKGTGVWVIAGNPAKVSWRPVTVLGLDDDHANVAGKLARGERIVALGAHLLREGEQVRIANTIAPASGATSATKTASAAGAQP